MLQHPFADRNVGSRSPCLRSAFTMIEALVVMSILALLGCLLFVAIQKVRNAGARLSCQNHLRQLGLALHQYHENHHRFPSGVRNHPPSHGLPDSEPFPLMTWHTRLLPYVEQEALWQKAVQSYSQDRYWLAIPPHTAATVSIRLFLCPADSPRQLGPFVSTPASPPGLTSFLGVEGVAYKQQTGMLYLDSATSFPDVTDGTSNTLMVGERPPDLYGDRGRWYGGWGRWGNTDSTLGVKENGILDNKCPPGPYPFQPGRIAEDCSVYHFWSLHSGGANFLFVDGGVRFLTYSAADVLPALATRAGGESQPIPE